MIVRRRSLADAFARGASPPHRALIPYIVAGDPDVETTERVLDALGDADVAAIELGIPYGDPLADGPTIAGAAQRALLGGMTLRAALDIGARAYRRGSPPIFYFTYANPVDRMGIEHFAEAAARSGAAGAIVPDVSLEEIDPLRDALRTRGLALPLLVAPTTPPQRARAIVARSSGFVYVVSRIGVTGTRRTADLVATAERVAELRAHSPHPLAVGFGIATRDDVRAVTAFADAAVVGSALVEAYAGTRGAEAARRAGAFVRGLTA